MSITPPQMPPPGNSIQKTTTNSQHVNYNWTPGRAIFRYIDQSQGSDDYQGTTNNWAYIDFWSLLYWYYKTLTTNRSSNILNCCIYQAAADTLVNDFTWTHCASGLFNTAWFIHMLLLMRNMSQSPLHTVSRKHLVQPGNHSKTLNLSFIMWYCSSILRFTVSPIHKYRSEPPL